MIKPIVEDLDFEGIAEARDALQWQQNVIWIESPQQIALHASFHDGLPLYYDEDGWLRFTTAAEYYSHGIAKV